MTEQPYREEAPASERAPESVERPLSPEEVNAPQTYPPKPGPPRLAGFSPTSPGSYLPAGFKVPGRRPPAK
jgi:hypothetical protein